MNFVDLFSLSLHRAVAEKMITNEAEVLRIARQNLDRWLNGDNFIDHGRRALLEWRDLLDGSTTEEIRQIISADTDEGQRLRSSSPFAGVLTNEERQAIWRKCSEVSPALI
jgi:hypothetical protein